MKKLNTLLRPKEVAERTGLSRVTLWRMVRDGQFPQPLEISPNRIGWTEEDILKWQAGLSRRFYGLEKLPRRAYPLKKVKQ